MYRRGALFSVALTMSALVGVAAVAANSTPDQATVVVATGDSPAPYTVTRLGRIPGGGAATGLSVLDDGRVALARQLGVISIFDPADDTFSSIRTTDIAVPSTGQVAQAGVLDITSFGDRIYVSYLCWRGEPVVVHCVDELDLSGAKLRTTRWGDNFTHAFTPGNHNGGGIATDGQYLYIGTGDDTQSSNPGQDPSSLKAKIVRMPISTLSPVELVALGIRQPFGLIMNGNELIEFDVGLSTPGRRSTGSSLMRRTR
ncbi:MAG: PQQ-dependent sugar dehydrogenase [Ilumatobacteraceae bacterium]